jgi:ABC-type hemin transport system ATPase subunit
MARNSVKYRTKKLFKVKRGFHRQKARMSFSRKIQELVEMQKLANEIREKTGRKPGFVWQI